MRYKSAVCHGAQLQASFTSVHEPKVKIQRGSFAGTVVNNAHVQKKVLNRGSARPETTSLTSTNLGQSSLCTRALWWTAARDAERPPSPASAHGPSPYGVWERSLPPQAPRRCLASPPRDRLHVCNDKHLACRVVFCSLCTPPAPTAGAPGRPVRAQCSDQGLYRALRRQRAFVGACGSLLVVVHDRAILNWFSGPRGRRAGSLCQLEGPVRGAHAPSHAPAMQYVCIWTHPGPRELRDWRVCTPLARHCPHPPCQFCGRAAPLSRAEKCAPLRRFRGARSTAGGRQTLHRCPTGPLLCLRGLSRAPRRRGGAQQRAGSVLIIF